MRLFLAYISGIAVLFFSMIAGAQSQTDVQPPTSSQHETSSWPSSSYMDQDQRQQDEQDDVCYTMRTYLFARRDAEPPRLVATFTCTPTRRRDLKRAQAEPKLVPAQR